MVVYLDVSSSMAGYVAPNGKVNFAVSPDGQTIFSHALQELRNVVTTLNPSVNIVFRRIASTVESPSYSDLELGQASVNRGIYTGAETNLAGAINLFSTPLKVSSPTKTSEGELAEDNSPAPPARFHILVTDGVQSTKQQRTDGSCTAGSDYVCVKKAINALLEKGWAGCVIGVKSEFNGKVFSEIKPGLSIQYESKKADPKTHRPFYFYIFSPDPAAIDKLVDALKGRLRPMLKQEESLREYAISTRYAESAGSAEIIVPKESANNLERTKARDETPARLTLRVDLNTEKKGPQPFNIAVSVPWSGHAKDSGMPQELGSLLRWELIEVPLQGSSVDSKERTRFPEVRLVGQQVDEQSRPIVQATAHWPQGTGTPRWKAYRLVGRLDVEKQTPPWVSQWSTNVDTTADVANRTLNLESALAGLWRNSIMEKQVIAEAYLRVGPQ
ncbi:MAG TPA: hypothetical protein VEY11_08210 [Pyrinomonadaceae bacterium]|nr:hypothetical protein [Pyrinomonadaceae bacterium]